MDYEAEVRTEYLEELSDQLHTYEITLSNISAKPAGSAEIIRKMAQDVAAMRFKGRSTHLPMIETVLHRFHDYLRDMGEPTDMQLTDLRQFTEVLQGLVSGQIPSDESSIPEMVRTLPSKKVADVEDLVADNVEILVVVPERTMLAWLQRELAACGYRVFGSRNSFDAMQIALRSRPDMVMVSGQIDELTGVDFACALRAMPTTRDMPVCLLTSSSRKIADLPDGVRVLKKGPEFGDDLAETLQVYGIT